MAMKSFLRAFGFRSNDDDLDDELDAYPSALPVAVKSSKAPAHCPAATVAPEPEPAPAPPTCDAALIVAATELQAEEAFPLSIFDSLLNIFNEAQPDFIRKCLDKEAQRRYLYDSVDASFRDYMMRIKDDARREADRDRESSRHRMMEEIDLLRAQVAESAKTAEAMQSLKASSDRQKRTFNERIRDLERQLAGAMAEKEQYDLEVKSLLNKLKVVQVQQNDIQELDELRQRLADANRQITSMNAANAMRENSTAASRRETDQLKARVAELEAELEAAKAAPSLSPEPAPAVETTEAYVAMQNRLIQAEATMRAAEERTVEAEAQVRELVERLECAEESVAVAESRAAEAEARAVEAETRALEAEKRAAAPTVPSEIPTVEVPASETTAETSAEVETTVEVDTAIDDEPTTVKGIVTEDEAVSDDVDPVAIAAESVEAYPESGFELLIPVEPALPSLPDVAAEVECVSEDVPVTETPKKRRGRPKKSVPRISAIDESMDSTEWLVATPPEGSNLRVAPPSDADFGYQEPPRKSRAPQNDAQMSLF